MNYKNYFKNPSGFYKGKKHEFYGQCKNGDIIPIEIRLSYLKYKGNTYTKAMISDISKRKCKENKIIEDKLLLEKEVKKKISSFSLCLMISAPKTSRGEMPGRPKSEFIIEIYADAKRPQGTTKLNLTHLLSVNKDV